MSLPTKLQALQAATLILSFSMTSPLEAQCQGRLQTGTMQQNRLQSTMQQSRMQTTMNQQQQNSLAAARQQQQSMLNAIVQQQQQFALRAALQQLQLTAQLIASQQLSLNQPQPTTAILKAAPQRRQPGSGAAEESEVIPPAPTRQNQDADSVDDTAMRRMRMAKELATDANQARARGERKWAAKLREKAAERLQDIVESYPTTPSAAEAKVLIETLYR